MFNAKGVSRQRGARMSVRMLYADRNLIRRPKNNGSVWIVKGKLFSPRKYNETKKHPY